MSSRLLHAVTLVRSPIGRPPQVRKTLKALGLTKIHKTVVHKNTSAVNGMLQRVIDCVEVKTVHQDVVDAALGEVEAISQAQHFDDEDITPVEK